MHENGKSEFTIMLVEQNAFYFSIAISYLILCFANVLAIWHLRNSLLSIAYSVS